MTSSSKENMSEDRVVISTDPEADMFYAATPEEYERAVRQANKASRQT